MGSINGTIKDVIDEMRADGVSVGLVTLVDVPPVPDRRAARGAGARARRASCIDKALDVGMGGPLASNVAIALRGLPQPAGDAFGDRRPRRPPVTKASLHRLFRQATIQPWEGPHFLDLNERVVGARTPSPRQDAPRRAGGGGHPQEARTERGENRGARRR